MVFTAIQNVARVVLTLNGDANGTMSNHIIYMSKSALELHSDLDSASQFCGFCQLPSQFDNTSDNVTTSASCYQLGVLKRSKFLIFFSCLITFILAGIHF